VNGSSPLTACVGGRWHAGNRKCPQAGQSEQGDKAEVKKEDRVLTAHDIHPPTATSILYVVVLRQNAVF
jgi:hypothetical protein